jgi:hypothetical protein
MSEKTRLTRDDAYEEMGSAYQCVQVAMLNAALLEHGVADAQVRQKVCETFLFQLGEFHDFGWMKPTADSKPVHPLLCFSEGFLNTDTPVDELGAVYAPSEFFSYHEYAFGNAGLLFDGDPEANVVTGVVGAETGDDADDEDES